MADDFYFAYGSNIDQAQMRDRCPTATIKGIGKLPGHKFIINCHGVATVTSGKESTVYGILWNITEANEERLDIYEGVKQGFYTKSQIEIETELEKVFSLIYLASDSELGAPRDDYVEKIVAAAINHGLSDSYIEELQSWQNKIDE
jgi:gamma-glutamylcyclotransferase (GGCT)/AIG2-like uncharacterized protein YtfP